MAPASPDRPWQPGVDASGTLSADQRPRTSPPPADYVLPPDPFAATMPVTPTIDPARIYGLAELIDLAEQTNPETRIAWNEARDAALAAGIARSSYLPRLTATALGGYEAHNGHASASGLSAGERGSAMGAVSTLSLSWLLFDFGQRDALVTVADQGTVIADIAFTAAHQRLIHTVSLAFYAYVAARARAGSAALSLADARAVQTAADDRKAQGVGTVMEVAQAAQFTAQANLAKVQADGAVADSYVALLSAIGLPPLLSIRIANVTTRAASKDLNGQIDRVLANALSRRPDVLAALAAQKAADAGVRAAQAELRPKIFLSASGTHATGDIDLSALPAVGADSPTVNISSRRWGATILGGITVPIYDAGVRTAQLGQARDRASSAASTVTRVKLDAMQEIVAAEERLRSSVATLGATDALLSASQIAFDASLAAFRHGVGSSTDTLVAERQLLEARDAAADARSGTLTAAASLALACGQLGEAPG